MHGRWKLGIVLVLCAMLVGFFAPKRSPAPAFDSNLYLFSPNASASAPIRLSRPKDMLSIRMLILRHTPEQMAVADSSAAKKAVADAAAQGLDIKVIGDHLVTKVEKDFISQQMKIDAVPGDTLIVYTVGHGSPQGTLQALGKRSDVMKAIAEAAAENKQETLWWQLSCYSASGMPGIETLPDDQRSIYSNLVSSPANQLSYTMVQAGIMAKLFSAMANDNSGLDANKDNVLTAVELRNYLDTVDNAQRGKLFYSLTPDEVVFGERIFYHMIPIVDLNSPSGAVREGYIPLNY